MTATNGTLPEVLGPADLPKLNEGLRYLFKGLREAQATYASRPYAANAECDQCQ